jgi:hypothetical protein
MHIEKIERKDTDELLILSVTVDGEEWSAAEKKDNATIDTEAYLWKAIGDRLVKIKEANT